MLSDMRWHYLKISSLGFAGAVVVVCAKPYIGLPIPDPALARMAAGAFLWMLLSPLFDWLAHVKARREAAPEHRAFPG
jgi:Na+-driven multidrug efflux pump